VAFSHIIPSFIRFPSSFKSTIIKSKIQICCLHAMDPASILGIASSAITIATRLYDSVLTVQNMLEDISNIDELTAAMRGEIDAFEFVLAITQSELRRGSLMSGIQEWWDPMRLDQLLSNAAATFSKFEAIFGDISRKRTVLRDIRQYYRISQYDRHVQHLRLRVNTYTSCLHLAVGLAMSVTTLN
jgi:hypothetical protein